MHILNSRWCCHESMEGERSVHEESWRRDNLINQCIIQLAAGPMFTFSGLFLNSDPVYHASTLWSYHYFPLVSQWLWLSMKIKYWFSDWEMADPKFNLCLSVAKARGNELDLWSSAYTSADVRFLLCRVHQIYKIWLATWTTRYQIIAVSP